MRNPTTAEAAALRLLTVTLSRNDGIGTAAAALVVGRGPAEPASGYGSSARCDRIDRRALAVSRATCRCRALMACEHAAACYALPPGSLCGALGLMWCSHTALRAPYPSPVHPWSVWGRWFRVASAWVSVTLPNLKIDRFPSTLGCR